MYLPWRHASDRCRLFDLDVHPLYHLQLQWMPEVLLDVNEPLNIMIPVPCVASVPYA